MKNQMKILTPISSLDAPLERSASSRIIMKEFLFSIWFISLSSNLKLSIDLFIMSVCHVFADFRFIFVKCSCSRLEGTSLFSLFYKIILYIQGSRLRPNATIFWECASKNLMWLHLCKCMVCCSKAHALPAAAHCSRRKISLIRCKRFSRAWFHTARVKAEQRQRSCAYAEREQRAPIVLSLARQQEHEGARSGGFGFQTKVKDRFLKQRRWTCWYSCRKKHVLSATAS